MAERVTESLLVLGVDTCGTLGSVALARLRGAELELLGQVELDGRSYSERLVGALGELLAGHGVGLREVGCVVAVSGPGSFTGVRIGLSAVKGLAGGAGVPVVAVSRLEALAGKAGVGAAAMDAHRGEVFLRVDGREMLAGMEELAAVAPVPAWVAVCDSAAGKLLESAWAGCEQVLVGDPTAEDAIRLAMPRILAREFADLALLDGNYLRRSDAEIHLAGAARQG